MLQTAYRDAATALATAIARMYRTIPAAKHHCAPSGDGPECVLDRMAEASRQFVRRINTLHEMHREMVRVASMLDHTATPTEEDPKP